MWNILIQCQQTLVIVVQYNKNLAALSSRSSASLIPPSMTSSRRSSSSSSISNALRKPFSHLDSDKWHKNLLKWHVWSLRNFNLTASTNQGEVGFVAGGHKSILRLHVSIKLHQRQIILKMKNAALIYFRLWNTIVPT